MESGTKLARRARSSGMQRKNRGRNTSKSSARNASARRTPSRSSRPNRPPNAPRNPPSSQKTGRRPKRRRAQPNQQNERNDTTRAAGARGTSNMKAKSPRSSGTPFREMRPPIVERPIESAGRPERMGEDDSAVDEPIGNVDSAARG